MNEPWKITLLGGLWAERDQGHATERISRFYTYKYGALLAYLAYYQDRAHTREALIAMLWPESGEKQGRNSLSQALSSLRHQLEPPGTPANAVLRADRFSISLNPLAVTTDVALFEREIKAAATLAGKSNNTTTVERRSHLARALDLYRGPLLPGCYEDWITGEQERLSGLFFGAAGRLITELEATGDPSGALDVARQAVSADPLREEGQGHLIRLLAVAGQPAAALRQYREFERLLEADTGDEPSPALQALFRQIEKEAGTAVVGDSAPRMPRPSPALTGVTGTGTDTDTVTFLFTDIEGSTGQWERAQAREPDGGTAFRQALERHHYLLRSAFAQHGGQEVKEAGDGFLVAFASAGKALACAVDCQKRLAGETWPEAVGPLSVRMALHSGDIAINEAGEYHGLTLHRASRILLAGHGGQILVSEATAALVRRDMNEDIRLIDLGAFRLRDIPTPERLFQVEYPEQARHAYPPLRAEAGFANTLPLQFTRFFGREQEIGTLQTLLLDPALRLLTVTGPGGTGKTRLSLAVAERLMEPLKGAIWFTPLADLTDPGLIPGAILDALRLSRSPQRDPLDQVVEALSKQPSLLLLDNFEHLIEGGGTDTVRALLARVKTLTILITSRQIVGLTGEQEFALSPLPTPGRGDTLERLSLFDSVRLFVDRAQAVRPDFQVTNANAPAVAALCDGLEGIPLALELAAARAQVMTPGQMLLQLEHRFDFLTSRKRDVGERQRTLKGAIDWSYQLLAPELQRFFGRLSVFRGGWSAESAEAVCEEPLALDYLAQLRECSMVLAEETEHDMRFHLMETLRQYAEGQLTAAETDFIHHRHAQYYLQLSEETNSLVAKSGPARHFERMEAEHENFRAVLDRLRTSGIPQASETGLRMAGALAGFWRIRGYWEEGRQRLEYFLSVNSDPVGEANGHIAPRAKAFNEVAILSYLLGRPEEARRLALQAKSWSEAGDDGVGVAQALNSLSLIAKQDGDMDAAIVAAEESLAHMRGAGSAAGTAVALTNLMILHCIKGDYAAARAIGEEALELTRTLGDILGVASNLNNLAIIAQSQGDYEATEHMLREALAINQETGNRLGQAINLTGLGELAQEQGDNATAEGHYTAALAIERDLGNQQGIASTLHSLGSVASARGRYDLARTYYQESITQARGIGARGAAAESLQAIGGLCLKQGRYEEAEDLLQESLTDLREMQSACEVWRGLLLLGELALHRGDVATAEPLLRESLTGLRDQTERPMIADALRQFAIMARLNGDDERAARLLAAEARLRNEIGLPMQSEDATSSPTVAQERSGNGAYAVVAREGTQMTWEQAVAYALGETGAAE